MLDFLYILNRLRLVRTPTKPEHSKYFFRSLFIIFLIIFNFLFSLLIPSQINAEQGCLWNAPFCFNKCGLVMVPNPDPNCEQHYNNQTGCEGDIASYVCIVPTPSDITPTPATLGPCIWTQHPLGGGDCYGQCGAPEEYAEECDQGDNTNQHYCENINYTCSPSTGSWRCTDPISPAGSCEPCTVVPDCVYSDFASCNANCGLLQPVVPPPPKGIFCSGENRINTAIGCIPIFSEEGFFGFILVWAIGIGGGIAFLLIIAAGFAIITSQGDPKRLQGGKDLLTAAVGGLFLLIFSIFLLRLIGVEILKIPEFGNP